MPIIDKSEGRLPKLENRVASIDALTAVQMWTRIPHSIQICNLQGLPTLRHWPSSDAIPVQDRQEGDTIIPMSGLRSLIFGLVLGFGGFMTMALAGINWKAVWIEPWNPVVLKVGDVQSYKIVGLSGADVKAELTLSRHLKIASLDPAIVEVDQAHARLIGKRIGETELKISFSEATSLVKVYVQDRVQQK